MKTKRKKNLSVIGIDEYIRINKQLSREEELKQHCGWISKDRPHKNKKKYDRKRDRKIDDTYLSFFVSRGRISTAVGLPLSFSF